MIKEKMLMAMQENLTTNMQAEKCAEICHQEMIAFANWAITYGFDYIGVEDEELLRVYLSNNSNNPNNNSSQSQ